MHRRSVKKEQHGSTGAWGHREQRSRGARGHGGGGAGQPRGAGASELRSMGAGQPQRHRSKKGAEAHTGKGQGSVKASEHRVRRFAVFQSAIRNPQYPKSAIVLAGHRCPRAPNSVFQLDFCLSIAETPSIESVAGSSNGRTADSGSACWGSNPCPAANDNPADSDSFCLLRAGCSKRPRCKARRDPRREAYWVRTSQRRGSAATPQMGLFQQPAKLHPLGPIV